MKLQLLSRQIAIRKFAFLCALALLFVATAFAQEPGTASAQKTPAGQAVSQPDQPTAEQRAEKQPGAEQKVAEESKEAAGEENAQFRQSPSVKWLSSHLNIPLGAAYWVFISINFAIVAAFILWGMKKTMPGFFRNRSGEISRALAEARRSSSDAQTRLSEIESRLARIDAEVADMRAQAEQGAAAEDQRARAAADEEKQRILTAAEQEIDAAARTARRDLKTYAASLAVELAERRIQIDPNTDRALVSQFARQFGKDGQ